MKKSIFTLLAIIVVTISAGSIQAQTKSETKPAEAISVYKAEISKQEKETMLQVLEAAKSTILKSSNANTTEQNLMLINGIEHTMNFINDKFQKPVEEQVKPKKQ